MLSGGGCATAKDRLVKELISTFAMASTVVRTIYTLLF